MSLNTAVRKNHGKKAKLEELEETAKEFSRMVWERDKGALDYFNSLSQEVKDYIKAHKEYSLDLRSAQFSHI